MPSGSRLALLALCSLLVLGSLAAQPTLGAASGAAAVDGAGTAAVASEQPAYNTTMRIELEGDGDARWHVSTTFNLTDEADREAFRQLASEFENGQASIEWLSAFRHARMRASRTIGRNMQIHSVDRSWTPPENETGPGTGRLTLSFTWTDFAQVDDDGQRLSVGDVLAEPSPPLLEDLQAGESLVVVPPDGYTPVTGSGDLREGSFYWEGPVTFGDEPPSAVFTGGGGPPTLLVAGVVVAGLLVLLLFVYLVASRRTAEASDDVDGAAPAATSEPVGEDAAPAEPDDAEATDEDIDVELLSDEERVERLLDRNGGRMKQATIVKETGWSNAKVSQLLSAMEEADRIDKLRIGRENLISFPDEDVADVEE